MFFFATLILISLFIFCLPALAHTEEEEVQTDIDNARAEPADPPAGSSGDTPTKGGEDEPGADPNTGTRKSQFSNGPAAISVLPSLNAFNSLQSARVQHMSALDSILATTAENITNIRSLPVNGPYRAQVLASYPANSPHQPPNSSARAQGGDSFPWIVARIDELHSHLPHPGRFSNNLNDPETALNYVQSIIAHYETGVFFPINDDPGYHVPQPGDVVSVTYTNAASYSGGRYVAEATSNSKVPTRIGASGPCNNSQLNINSPGDGTNGPLGGLGEDPLDSQDLVLYLQSRGVTRRLALDIARRSLTQGNPQPARSQWANIVPAALFTDNLSKLFHRQMRVLGNNSAWRLNTTGQHGQFRALDITCNSTDAEWNRIMQYCINYYIERGSEDEMGFGLYLDRQSGGADDPASWNIEKQIHIDFNYRQRRWVYGMDTNANGRPNSIHEFMIRNPGPDNVRPGNLSFQGTSRDGDSMDDVAYDTFWYLIQNPGTQGYVTNAEVQQRFNPRSRTFLGSREWFKFNGTAVPEY